MIKKVALALSLLLFTFISSQAQPCKKGYDYRVPVFLDNTKEGAIQNYQIPFKLNTSKLIQEGKMNSDGSDIRFLNSTGDSLAYYLETNTINTNQTLIWIKKKYLRAYSVDTIYLYYGNKKASSVSNPNQTFENYEEFVNRSSLPSSWSSCGSGQRSIVSNALEIKSNTNAPYYIDLGTTSSSGYFEVKLSNSNKGNAFLGIKNQNHEGYAIGHGSSSTQFINLSSGSPCFGTTIISNFNSSSRTGIFGVAWLKNGEQQINYESKTQIFSNTSNRLSIVQNLILGVRDSTNTLKIDWIRFRKYHPSLTWVFGKEQSTQYTISPNYQKPLCEEGDLELYVDTIEGAKYNWTGPNNFASSLQNPKLTNVKSQDAGLYIVVVELPQGCASKTSSVNVTISPKARGGTLTGSQTVCSGQNLGIISLKNNVGNIQQWDSSQDNGITWHKISNTNFNNNYSNLATTTLYRAIVSNGNCSTDTSSTATITTTPPSKGGLVSKENTVCYGSNSGLLTLSNYQGQIMRWEYSLNGNLWKLIVNRGAIQNYTNLTKSTHYRAIVKNGICNETPSEAAKITVLSQSDGGTISGSTTACKHNNTGLLKINNYVGDIINWEEALDPAGPWLKINNTTDSLRFKQLKQTTYFRAIVRVGNCQIDESEIAKITIVSPASAGELKGFQEVCAGNNSGTILLKNYTGTIDGWLYKDTTQNWTSVKQQTDFFNYSNLNLSTEFAAVVSNGSCPADTTKSLTITVIPKSSPGYLTSSGAVCRGSNTVNIKTNKKVGKVKQWEWSIDGFSNWIIIKDTGSNLTLYDIDTQRYVRTYVQNKSCAAQYSNTLKIEVNNPPTGGYFHQNLRVCKNSNFGVIKLKDYEGIIKGWLKSNDQINWNQVSNSGDFEDFRDLDQTTYYRVILSKNACPNDTSSVGIVYVDSTTESGIISEGLELCDTINSGFIKLSNHRGNILAWEYSLNKGENWIDTVVNSDTFNYNNLKQSVSYRVLLRNGVCQKKYSPSTHILISKKSDAGTLSGELNHLCEGRNFNRIQSNKYIGNIIGWEYLEADSTNWKSFGSQNDQLFIYNQEKTTEYRVIVQNNSCTEDTSQSILVKVSPIAIAGSIETDNNNFCYEDSVKLFLNQKVGKLIKWEQSVDGQEWNEIASNIDTLNLKSIKTDMLYRAYVKSGECSQEYSPNYKLTITMPARSGTILGADTVCSSSNEGILNLSNSFGEVQEWQKKSIGESTWTKINEQSQNLNYSKLEKSTEFRVVVKNKNCKADTSGPALIHIIGSPVAEFEAIGKCEGAKTILVDKSTSDSSNLSNRIWLVNNKYLSDKQEDTITFYNAGKQSIGLIIEDDRNCKTSIEKTVEIKPSPSANFNLEGSKGASIACLNSTSSSKNLSNINSNKNLTYNWYLNSKPHSQLKEPDFKFYQLGSNKIKLTVKSVDLCSDSTSRYIHVLAAPEVYAGEDMIVSKGVPFQLIAKGAQIYEWSPSNKILRSENGIAKAKITEATQFIVKGTDYQGCSSYDTVFIDLEDRLEVFPTNVVTPNGNGKNDVWIVNNIENYSNHQIQIFNRWGQTVFETNDYKNDWSGKNTNKQQVQDGTYYYVININDGARIYKGAITLINK